MKVFLLKSGKTQQYTTSLLLVIVVAALCYALSSYLGYRVVAFILLLTVSLIAVIFDIVPVLLAATVSALLWNYFFIPPRFNFNIHTTEDTILFFMYFVIALISGILTYKIRRVEKMARKKEEAANVIKLYDTLLNSLSHELRTPIATILAATDNLQEHEHNLSKDVQQQLLGEISKASLRLNHQVENLLNMSRLDSGFIQPKMDWCDLTEIVYATIRKIDENQITQHLVIQINQDLPMIRSDKTMLEQIVYNVISNACRYSGAESVITISIGLLPDKIKLIIEDNGVGIPEEEIKNVFDRFYRLPHSKAGGTGLGLSIVKGFAESLNGKVFLKNNPSGGLRFTLELPCETSSLNVILK